MDDPRTELAAELMTGFAERTGLTGRQTPRRYLWTDAFALGAFLALERKTGDSAYTEAARALVDQVHHTLGRHRTDDPRAGWISGLDDERGETHPTLGGLRIGKPEPERRVDEPLDERREWDRDGQYFQYVAKWIAALDRFGRETGHRKACSWARELADKAHRRFVFGPARLRRMYSKMSIDLERPLVATTDPRDPLEGLIACLELANGNEPPLEDAIHDFAALVEPTALSTSDPLGLGCLLVGARRLAALHRAVPRNAIGALVTDALRVAADGLDIYRTAPGISLPAYDRVAFRELGLAIGLAAFQEIDRDALPVAARTACAQIDRHAQLRAQIEASWLRREHRASRTWTEHADINDVMLACSLVA